MVILDIRYMYRNWIYYIILNIIYNHGNNIIIENTYGYTGY